LKKNICIVIPCYNEEKRLPQLAYENFLRLNSETLICFVNDGSSDNTLGVLETLQTEFTDNIAIISNPKNLGKAESVRNGMHFCNENFNFNFIAYLDADLSTSLEECASLTKYLKDSITFAFGSRIMKIGSVIERRPYRFLTGRIIATIISLILKLKVYDTQCGCKIFTKELSAHVFKKPFISKWLFDVEIFYRIILVYGRDKVLNRMLEIPLKRWIDVGKSKVKISFFLRLWVDLYLIHKTYKRKEQGLRKTKIASVK
tara:strand:+ start:2424 stop:3200 length:777 start_codon:yes stop_codon:yes gene_type:complete